MLCVWARRQGIEVPYKDTHVTHPVTQWLLSNKHHVLWVYNHGRALVDEKHHRYPHNKRHDAEQVLLDLEAKIPESPLSRLSFPNCARREDLGVDYTHVKPVTQAYRLYLRHRWLLQKQPPSWTRRPPPVWALKSPGDPSMIPVAAKTTLLYE